jgi:hypothetical protein
MSGRVQAGENLQRAGKGSPVALSTFRSHSIIKMDAKSKRRSPRVVRPVPEGLPWRVGQRRLRLWRRWRLPGVLRVGVVQRHHDIDQFLMRLPDALVERIVGVPPHALHLLSHADEVAAGRL